MSIILAIETATEACSAALVFSENKNTESNPPKVVLRFQLAPREHTKLILPMLDEVLEEGSIQLKDVDAIAFGRGPGAFTGLRIAAGIAQGIALSVDKPVISVSTLAALAQQVALTKDYKNETIIAAIDARMGEVYWGEFKVKNGVAELVGKEQVSKPELMFDSIRNESTIGIGSGWDVYADGLLSDNASAKSNNESINIRENCLPSAEFIARLALSLFNNNNVLLPEDAQPIYIRNDVAKKAKHQ